jgi:hypothetical protein
MPADTFTPQLAPHLTPDHTSWPLGHMCHIGAFRCERDLDSAEEDRPDDWEVAYHGPDVWESYAVYSGYTAQDHAEDVARTLALAWDTVQQIPVAAMRSLLEFFQPKATA